MRARVTIGDFSRASHLSVKTLRHYHEVGLLEPDEVDPGTGYRYYSEDQIPVAQVIRRLRGLQMPVADVKAVLAAPDPDVRNRLIVAHLDRLEGELAQTRAAVAELRGLLTRPTSPRAVEYRTVPATAAIAIRATIDREDVLAWWQGALGELRATLGAQGLQAGGAGRWRLRERDLPARPRRRDRVHPDRRGGSRGRTRRTLDRPAAELAIMLHCGSLADDDLTYGELAAHVMRHEISVDGAVREYYLVGFLDTADSGEWKTEIGWPIFRSDA